MIKRILKFTLAVCLTFSFTFVLALAEEPTTNTEGDFAANKSKYNEMCGKPSSQLSAEEQKTCSAYINYMSKQSSDLTKQLKEIESKRAEIAADIKVYAEKIRNYDKQISVLRAEINSLNEEIAQKEEEIRIKEEEIIAQQAEIDALKEKVKSRMVIAQKIMRLNQYLDVIIGAKDFNDLIRRSNGINDIVSYDQVTLDQMADLIEQLNTAKAALVVAKADLDTKKESVVKKQNELIVFRSEAELVRQEYLKKEAELEAEGNKIAGNLEAIKNTMRELSSKLGAIAMSSGFNRPIGGGKVSAGTWNYPSSFGGGVHLGMDFAAAVGTTVYAAGNGVVLKSVDGCGYGYLGNSCGGDGSSGGGNQIYLLTKISGSLYAVKYLHLNAGSPIPTGTIVNGGDRIADLGSSGNSTGPHVHVEVFYLGNGSVADYAQNWNGDLSFGAGWGYSALSRLCANGVGAPCRVKPESVFGG